MSLKLQKINIPSTYCLVLQYVKYVILLVNTSEGHICNQRLECGVFSQEAHTVIVKIVLFVVQIFTSISVMYEDI